MGMHIPPRLRVCGGGGGWLSAEQTTSVVGACVCVCAEQTTRVGTSVYSVPQTAGIAKIGGGAANTHAIYERWRGWDLKRRIGQLDSILNGVLIMRVAMQRVAMERASHGRYFRTGSGRVLSGGGLKGRSPQQGSSSLACCWCHYRASPDLTNHTPPHLIPARLKIGSPGCPFWNL